MYEAHIMFRTVIEQDFTANKRLDTHAPIVRNAAFEKAIVMVQYQ